MSFDSVPDDDAPMAVNEEDEREVTGFVPTRAELIQLARYWERIFLEQAYYMFTEGVIRDDVSHLLLFAERRVMRIINVVDIDAFIAVKRVRCEFAKHLGPEEWGRFLKFLEFLGIDRMQQAESAAESATSMKSMN
jgi:hypothetical protein